MRWWWWLYKFMAGYLGLKMLREERGFPKLATQALSTALACTVLINAIFTIQRKSKLLKLRWLAWREGCSGI
jgi:hypothetical protein